MDAQNKKTVLDVLKKNGLALKSVNPELKKDREIVKTAIEQNGLAFKFAPAFAGDRELALLAAQKDFRALFFASRNLKEDKEFMMEASQFNDKALQYASQDIKADTVPMEAIFSDDVLHANEPDYKDYQDPLNSLYQELDTLIDNTNAQILDQEEAAIEALEEQGMTRSDAQGVLEAQEMLTESVSDFAQLMKAEFGEAPPEMTLIIEDGKAITAPIIETPVVKVVEAPVVVEGDLKQLMEKADDTIAKFQEMLFRCGISNTETAPKVKLGM